MKRWSVVDGALIILALASTVFLGLSYFRPTTRFLPPATAETLSKELEGLSLPVLRIQDHNGEGPRLELGAEQVTRLILVFTNDCSFCEQSVPAWNKLVSEFGSRIEVITVNTQSVALAEEWLELNEVAYDRLVVAASPADLVAWGVRGVPATLFVRGAHVVTAEIGALRGASLERMSRAIRESL
jgi:thiol-disulfide isomerase/thioredoxin